MLKWKIFHTSDWWSIWSSPIWWSRSFRPDVSLIPDLYGIVHVGGWELHNLHDLGQFSWVGSVLYRSCIAPPNSRLECRWSISRYVWYVWNTWTLLSKLRQDQHSPLATRHGYQAMLGLGDVLFFLFLFRKSSLLLSSSTRIHRRFYPQRSSGQAVVTGVVPSPPRYVPSFFILHRVQHSHCSSIFIECCQLTLSRFPLVNLYARKSPYEYVHSVRIEPIHEIDFR